MLFGEVNPVTVEVRNPPKQTQLRLPTPEEWMGRMAVQRSVQRSVGRRQTQMEVVPNPQADLELIGKIQVGGDTLDEAESQYFVGVLSEATVSRVERVGGDRYNITLAWSFGHGIAGETTHQVRVPTIKEATRYRRSVISIVDRPRGEQEVRYNLRAAVELYDAVVIESHGYAEGVPVPPTHKSDVTTELIQLMQEDDSPDF